MYFLSEVFHKAQAVAKDSGIIECNVFGKVAPECFCDYSNVLSKQVDR